MPAAWTIQRLNQSKCREKFGAPVSTVRFTAAEPGPNKRGFLDLKLLPDSRLQFGSLNHALGYAINPQRAIASDANILILLPLSEHSGRCRTCYLLAPVANDPGTVMASKTKGSVSDDPV